MTSFLKFGLVAAMAITLTACGNRGNQSNNNDGKYVYDATRQVLTSGRDRFEMIRTRTTGGEAVAMVRPLTFTFDNRRDDEQRARMNAIVPQVQAGLCPREFRDMQTVFSTTNDRTDYSQDGRFPGVAFTRTNRVNSQLVVHAYCEDNANRR